MKYYKDEIWTLTMKKTEWKKNIYLCMYKSNLCYILHRWVLDSNIDVQKYKRAHYPTCKLYSDVFYFTGKESASNMTTAMNTPCHPTCARFCNNALIPDDEKIWYLIFNVLHPMCFHHEMSVYIFFFFFILCNSCLLQLRDE